MKATPKKLRKLKLGDQIKVYHFIEGLGKDAATKHTYEELASMSTNHLNNGTSVSRSSIANIFSELGWQAVRKKRESPDELLERLDKLEKRVAFLEKSFNIEEQ